MAQNRAMTKITIVEEISCEKSAYDRCPLIAPDMESG